MPRPTIALLSQENEDLRRRLTEAEDALHALSAGEVDAVLVDAGSEQVYTLDPADKPYWLLVAHVPHPAATLSVEGTIISCNQRFADMVGQGLQSLPGKPFHDFVVPDGRQSVEILLRDGRSAEVQVEVPLRGADGARKDACFGVRPLREGVHGECLMITDLTERRHYQELKRAQEALRASEERLRAADRKKDEFLAMLAHELRNPLAPIRNALELLEVKKPDDTETSWAWNVVSRQTHMMARLLDDLLDVSRMALSRVELRIERVELAAVCDAAIEISRPLIEAGRHELTVHLPSQPVVLAADPLRLAQVLANLLNNAARYTEDGGRIQLSAELMGEEVRVSVKDSGVGISPELLPDIFELFSRATHGLARSNDGLGIGLSLVKGLVELHGGSVEAHSEGPGRGSEFTVRLPIAVELPAGEPARAGEDEAPPLTKRRILIVDDNRDGTDSLVMLLGLMGNEVGAAYDGEQALQLTETTRPEVVLLDLGMPRLDGYEVCRRIRAQPWGREVVLIAVTGWGQEADRRRTEEAGFDHHLVKPVDPVHLKRLLGSLPSRGATA